MPTGCTAGVADGTVTTLREFALTVARGMGALILMRDDPMDAPIPDRFEPSPHYAKSLADAKARLAELEAMTPEQREAGAAAARDALKASQADSAARHTETRNRYQAMLAQVVAWEGAPEGLKEYMLDQLHRSIEFDCPDDALDNPLSPQSTDEWFAKALADAKWSVEYRTKATHEEAERTEARNAWLAQLRASLPAA
jgi:hypothetical protein